MQVVRAHGLRSLSLAHHLVAELGYMNATKLPSRFFSLFLSLFHYSLSLSLSLFSRVSLCDSTVTPHPYQRDVGVLWSTALRVSW